LVDSITVYEGGDISVKFKHNNELRRAVEYIEISTKAQDMNKAG